MTTPLPALPSPIPSSARAPLSGVQFSLACETSAEAFEDLSIITFYKENKGDNWLQGTWFGQIKAEAINRS
ncbi:hypothetical protein MLD38_040096 [Melastoma candidum]|uniref:Uncharacterized protein n=1 Tax=Melastoma candidum TaxID=119954 RepID=A0ACB9L5S5_9MYRT|nr:hypothetical protein MLD38_040096 [Melastoma candidum]